MTSAGDKAEAREFFGVGEDGEFIGVDGYGDLRGLRHFNQMPAKAKTRHIGGGAQFERMNKGGGIFVQASG